MDYVGPHNNLMLVVNPDGHTHLQNQSTVNLALDGYLITSLSHSLDANNWTSFASNDCSWRVSNPANNHLGELKLGGSRLLAAESAAIDLGHAFVAGGEHDLAFTYHVAGMGDFLGTVEYEDGIVQFPASIPGDYNSDGKVNAADYVLWRKTPASFGDAGGYNTWRQNFGMGSGTGSLGSGTVPEPSATFLLTSVAICAVGVRRNRFA